MTFHPTFGSDGFCSHLGLFRHDGQTITKCGDSAMLQRVRDLSRRQRSPIACIEEHMMQMRRMRAGGVRCQEAMGERSGSGRVPVLFESVDT